MSAIIILILISVGVAISFLVAFLWAIRSDQYEDTYTPSLRILMDDGTVESKSDKNDKAVS